MAKKAVGIYFSKTLITFLEMEHAVSNPKVSHYTQFKYNLDNTDNTINDIKAYIKENKIKPSQVNVCFSGGQITHKRFLIPMMKTSELNSFVFRELRKTTSLPPSEFFFDYYIAKKIKEGGIKKLDIVSVITSKKEVNRYTSFLIKCGLIPHLMTTVPFALWSAYSISETAKADKTVTLIFINKTLVTIGIFSEGYISFSREFRLPKPQKADSENNDSTKEESSENTSILRKILTEVHRSILNYKHQFRDSTVDKIILATVEGDFSELAQKFKDDFNIEVESFNLDKKVTPPVREDITEEFTDSYLVPSGLVWKSIKDIKINILPRYVKERQKNIYKKVLTAVIAIAASILLVAGYFILNTVIDSYSTSFKSKQTALFPLQEDLKDIKKAISKRNIYNRKKKMVAEKEAPPAISKSLLLDFGLIQPNGMAYKALNINMNKKGDWVFLLSGTLTADEKPGAATANITKQFNTFVENLKSSPFILKIKEPPKIKIDRKLVQNKIISSLAFDITGALNKNVSLPKNKEKKKGAKN